jgi:hypothetical protein
MRSTVKQGGFTVPQNRLHNLVQGLIKETGLYDYKTVAPENMQKKGVIREDKPRQYSFHVRPVPSKLIQEGRRENEFRGKGPKRKKFQTETRPDLKFAGN